MRKKSAAVFAVTVGLILTALGGCEAEKPEETEKTEIDRNIILVCQYTNWADVPTNEGYCVDRNGIGYSFDFSDDDDMYSIESIVEFFEANYDDLRGRNEGRRVMTKEKAAECYGELAECENTMFNEESSQGFDMGEITWCGIINGADGETVVVDITQSGDWDRWNTDSHAVRAAQILEKMPHYYEEM